ncbi:MAG: carboxypeptidase-like regulatory domain-containing protein [Terracidiphilus sp.]|jgi:hypothetical protein
MLACIAAGFSAALAAGAWNPASAQEQMPGFTAFQEPAQQSGIKTPKTLVTVHGEVRDSATGQPLPRALVRIEGDADAGTLTDGEGRFEIPGVAAGPQSIRVVKPGFHDRPYATEEVGYPAEGPAHSVLLAEQMPDLRFTLTPNCAIHGHIELSTGDPAEKITVVLVKKVVKYGRAVWMQEAQTRTNGAGNYRFGGITDGVYAVYTLPSLESEQGVTAIAAGNAQKIVRDGFPAVFYPGAREFAGAARIQVAPGEQAEANFNLTLEPFYPVTAMGVLPGRESKTPPSSGNSAVVMDASGHLLPYIPQYDQATHTLQTNLPDGTYVMVMQAPVDITSFVANGQLVVPPGKSIKPNTGSVEFTVEGRPVTGLRIPIGPSPQNLLRLRFQHEAAGQAGANAPGNVNAAELVNLMLDRADGIPAQFAESNIASDGGPDWIDFTALPGSYWIDAILPRRGWCAGPLSAGGLNLARDPLALGLSAATPPMELTLTDNCATLALNLPAGLAAFVPGEEPFYFVYIVPDFDTPVYIPPMTIHPSSGSTLTIDGLMPGSYHVYTFGAPVHFEYRNPDAVAALANSGQAVTLSPGETANLTLEAPEH